MKFLNKLFGKIKEVVETAKYKKALKNMDIENSNTVYVDLGSSSVKMGYKGELVSFRSSMRRITDINEVSISKNYISVNNEWFAIGENIPTGNYEYKYQKPSKELILYGLMLLQENIQIDSNLKVSILLPYNELKYKSKFKSINGSYKVKNTKGEELEVNLVLSDNVAIEGECSKYFIEKVHKTKGVNTVVVNIGNKTTDVTVYNSNNNRESISSINIGGNYLLSKMLRFTKAQTSSILNTWLADGYKFNRDEEVKIAEVKKDFIDLIWNDVYNSAISMCNPQNTVCYIVGGTANLVSKEIISSITSEVNVRTLSNTESIYSDILGAMLINQDFNISTSEVIEVSNNIDDIDLDEIKVDTKISNFQRYIELATKGYTTDEICRIMNMKKQTIFNYKSKYKKQLQTTG